MFKTEEDRIKEKNEITYIAAYTILKKMLEDEVISSDVFDRLNLKMAERQNCVAFSN